MFINIFLLNSSLRVFAVGEGEGRRARSYAGIHKLSVEAFFIRVSMMLHQNRMMGNCVLKLRIELAKGFNSSLHATGTWHSPSSPFADEAQKQTRKEFLAILAWFQLQIFMKTLNPTRGTHKRFSKAHDNLLREKRDMKCNERCKI